MPAPPKNTNARKGEINRHMWSQRLPIDVITTIKTESGKLEISQADFVTLVMRQYNNKVNQNSS